MASSTWLIPPGTTFTPDGIIRLGTFQRSLTPEALEAIVNQPAVRQHMDTGLYGKRPVYIVSGLRVTKTGMAVTMEKGYTRAGGISAGVSGIAPAEIGVDIHRGRKKDNVDSWETAPGIIFAYILHVIREKGAGNVETEIFPHRTAFMTGIGEEHVEMELAKVLLEDLLEDPEDNSDLVKHNIGQDTCISFAPSMEA
ncbi:hypothetical protein N5P37_011560 [Trichoderma harzianum]|nr:hypothetical protein N5P37_011560 [Trichoderma harzianum]